MSSNKVKGALGEKIAVDYLCKELKMSIIDTNFRSNRAEIDIVAIRDSELRFVEGKTRMRISEDTLTTSLDAKKLKQLVKGASDYIATNSYNGIIDIYFDLVVVIFENNGEYKIEYTPAFFHPTW